MLRNMQAQTTTVQKPNALKPSPRNRRRFPVKLRYVAVVVLCAIAAYHYVTVQRVQLNQLSAKQGKLQKELVQLNQQHTTLAKQQKQLNENAYIARYASEHFHLILPGQVPFDVSH